MTIMRKEGILSEESFRELFYSTIDKLKDYELRYYSNNTKVSGAEVRWARGATIKFGSVKGRSYAMLYRDKVSRSVMWVESLLKRVSPEGFAHSDATFEEYIGWHLLNAFTIYAEHCQFKWFKL